MTTYQKFCDGLPRDVLESKLAESLERNAGLNDNLSSVQARCTELLVECRRLRAWIRRAIGDNSSDAPGLYELGLCAMNEPSFSQAEREAIEMADALCREAVELLLEPGEPGPNVRFHAGGES